MLGERLPPPRPPPPPPQCVIGQELRLCAVCNRDSDCLIVFYVLDPPPPPLQVSGITLHTR